MDTDSYLATQTLGREAQSNFPAGGDPERALEDAKAWLCARARKYFDTHEVTEAWSEFGSIIATGPEGPDDAPTATLMARDHGKLELDWRE